MSGDPFSRHPADQLIRELIATGRAATAEEVGRIVARLATAPFDPRVRKVRQKERGVVYQGRTIGAREGSLFYHLAKRVVVERQWADGTTASQYVADLQHSARSPVARLVLYNDRSGALVATITPTGAVVPPERQGPSPLPHLLVVYAAARGWIITGYQFSTLDRVRIPREALWLK